MSYSYNIKQLTTSDVINATDFTQGNYNIGDKKVTVTFKIVDEHLLGSDNVQKFGFCMNSNQGIGFPILLNESNNIFYLGKTGMFEWQKEDWQDVNGKTEEERELHEATYPLYRIYVPYTAVDDDGLEYGPFDFVFDYCY